MQRKRLLIISILCTGLILSCKKGKADVTVKGIIVDVTFAQPLADAEISLFKIEANSTQLDLVGTTTTDESGNYSFTFPRDQVLSYVISSEKANYFPVNEEISFSELSSESNNVFHFATSAKAWVKLHFVNIAPSSPSDQLKFLKQEGKAGCVGCAPTDEQFINGIVDTSIIYLNDGNLTFSYMYDVIGTSVFGIKSANTIAFDTTEILLQY